MLKDQKESEKEEKKNGQFQLVTEMIPRGDQPQAIESLLKGLQNSSKETLLGITGSGKTFTLASVIEKLGLPTLIIAPNKTLAAQLYGEYKTLFPHNAVGYFTSYYDYYQPEAYLPKKDLYIDKDAQINQEIDRLRHVSTQYLATRADVIIVATVSCIYGVGPPKKYKELSETFVKGEKRTRRDILKRLVELQYRRNDVTLVRRFFRVRGDIIDIYPMYEDNYIRIELFGDEIDRIAVINPVTNKLIEEIEEVSIFPGRHYVTGDENFSDILNNISQELEERVLEFKKEGKILEAQRLEQRTNYDIETIRETGSVSGIENYSRFFEQRERGTPPFTLMDHFPPEFLLIVDESHIALPQVRGMYNGDRSRKESLVKYGFRVPSALDNRPLKFDEFEQYMTRTIFSSATPGPYEKEHAINVVEQIIRPTGLLDPKPIIKESENQIDDLLHECRNRIEKNERVLVITLTKKMSEELADYFQEHGIKAKYIHSEIDTLDRVSLLRDLRLGNIDVLVGINLLREGLDLPEVSLVVILDADKEGFLRSERSLIQIMGRAARNNTGTVILYADRITDSLSNAVRETSRRRRIQIEYNREHNITPETVKTGIRNIAEMMEITQDPELEELPKDIEAVEVEELGILIKQLEQAMLDASKELEFEKAAQYRDKISELQLKYDKMDK